MVFILEILSESTIRADNRATHHLIQDRDEKRKSFVNYQGSSVFLLPPMIGMLAGSLSVSCQLHLRSADLML